MVFTMVVVKGFFGKKTLEGVWIKWERGEGEHKDHVKNLICTVAEKRGNKNI